MSTLKPQTERAYQATAFDLDGTLVDSVPDLFNVANLMLESLSLPPVTIDDVRLWIGDGIETLVARVLSRDFSVDPNLDPQVRAKAVSLFLQFYLDNIDQNSALYPNVAATLAKLRDSGQKMALVTNKARKYTLLLLKALDIHHTFDIIVCGDDLSHKKPHPLPMLHILEQLSLKPSQLLLVGDSKNDLLSAQQAGVDRAFVTYGYHQGINPEDYSPKYILDDFGQLYSVIK